MSMQVSHRCHTSAFDCCLHFFWSICLLNGKLISLTWLNANVCNFFVLITSLRRAIFFPHTYDHTMSRSNATVYHATDTYNAFITSSFNISVFYAFLHRMYRMHLGNKTAHHNWLNNCNSQWSTKQMSHRMVNERTNEIWLLR